MAKKPSSKNKGGRPPLISQEMQDKIVAAIHTGAYIETAAAFAGINKDTLYAWMKRGARAIRGSFVTETGEYDYSKIPSVEMLYVKFSDAIKTAMAEADLDDLKTLHSAKKENWQAAAWRLERRNPKKYGRNINRPDFDDEVEGPDTPEDPDRKWIIEQLKKTVIAALTPGDSYNPSAAKGALELLGKEQKMFIDRRLLGVRKIDDMSEEELLEFLDGEPGPEELAQAAGDSTAGES